MSHIENALEYDVPSSVKDLQSLRDLIEPLELTIKLSGHQKYNDTGPYGATRNGEALSLKIKEWVKLMEADDYAFLKSVSFSHMVNWNDYRQNLSYEKKISAQLQLLREDSLKNDVNRLLLYAGVQLGGMDDRLRTGSFASFYFLHKAFKYRPSWDRSPQIMAMILPETVIPPILEFLEDAQYGQILHESALTYDLKDNALLPLAVQTWSLGGDEWLEKFKSREAHQAPEFDTNFKKIIANL